MNKIKMKNIIKENSNDREIQKFMHKVRVHLGVDYDDKEKKEVLKHLRQELEQLILTVSGYSI